MEGLCIPDAGGIVAQDKERDALGLLVCGLFGQRLEFSGIITFESDTFSQDVAYLADEPNEDGGEWDERTSEMRPRVFVNSTWSQAPGVDDNVRQCNCIAKLLSDRVNLERLVLLSWSPAGLIGVPVKYKLRKYLP